MYYLSDAFYRVISGFTNALSASFSNFGNHVYAIASLFNDIEEGNFDYIVDEDESKLTLLHNGVPMSTVVLYTRENGILIPLSRVKDDVNHLNELIQVSDSHIIQTLIEDRKQIHRIFEKSDLSLDNILNGVPESILEYNLKEDINYEEMADKPTKDQLREWAAKIESTSSISTEKQVLSTDGLDAFDEDSLFKAIKALLEPLLSDDLKKSQQYRKDLFVSLIFMVVDKHLNNASQHVQANITGIISMLLGFFDTPEEYEEKNHSATSYQKYLRQNTINSVKRLNENISFKLVGS